MSRIRSIMVVVAALCALTAHSAHSAELIMLEQKGCAYCQLWDAQIGVSYPKTAEGQRAPLRRVDIHQPIPDDLADIRIERFTPSFILVEDGREIGRIRGYPGDEFFWFLLGDLLDDLPALKVLPDAAG